MSPPTDAARPAIAGVRDAPHPVDLHTTGNSPPGRGVMGSMSNVIDDEAGARTSDTGELTMYTTSWCGFCARLKTGLKASGIPWQEIDIELNPDAAEFVGSVNGGNHVVPTVLYADGTTATNPSIADVKKKLGV